MKTIIVTNISYFVRNMFVCALYTAYVKAKFYFWKGDMGGDGERRRDVSGVFAVLMYVIFQEYLKLILLSSY